jgi:glyoxylase-like metal-dependent hydrolase (beta-lactamase superfamily II)
MGISDIRKLVSELTQLPIIVLNSHTHNDHVGGNWQFDTIYSMDTDFSRQNAKGSTQDAQDELASGQVCGDLPKNFDPKTYRTKPWTISKYVQDGDVLDLGSRELQIIATPGHTPDSICLFDSAGLLFTGDTYYPATIWLYRPETDLALYEASVLRLAVQLHNIKMLHGAHNIPAAPSSVLPKLADASAELQAQVLRGGKGKGHCKPAGPAKKPARSVILLSFSAPPRSTSWLCRDRLQTRSATSTTPRALVQAIVDPPYLECGGLPSLCGRANSPQQLLPADLKSTRPAVPTSPTGSSPLNPRKALFPALPRG